MNRAFVALVAVCLSFPLMAADPPAPFGITLPMSNADAQKIAKKEIAPFILEVIPPKPHPDFETYSVASTPNAGVCIVRALTETVHNDSYGRQLRATLDRLREQIEGVYGPGDPLDFIRSKALWDEDGEWTMSIRQGERAYAVAWQKSKGANLPAPIASIALMVKAFSSSSGIVSIEYGLENYDACKAEMNAVQSKVF